MVVPAGFHSVRIMIPLGRSHSIIRPDLLTRLPPAGAMSKSSGSVFLAIRTGEPPHFAGKESGAAALKL